MIVAHLIKEIIVHNILIFRFAFASFVIFLLSVFTRKKVTCLHRSNMNQPPIIEFEQKIYIYIGLYRYV